MLDPVSKLATEPLVCKALEAMRACRREVWIVGGAVRDAALGRAVTDIDLAVAGDPKELASELARTLDGYRFELSSEHGTWRVVQRGSRDWQIDLTGLRSGTIEDDLMHRDFTVGAIAVPLEEVGRSDSTSVIDPLGGLNDLASGQLRAVSSRSFTDDPLRLMRIGRLAAQLDLEPDAQTRKLAEASSGLVLDAAGERVLEELRLLIGCSDPIRGIALLDSLGILAEVMPEVAAMHGVEQGPNHHLDVFDHTVEVLNQTMRLEENLAELLARAPAAAESGGAERLTLELDEFLAEPLGDGFSRRQALRLGALFHDVGKPLTRAERDGFVGFPGHDRKGAELIAAIGKRLAMSRKLNDHVARLALHHLRLGFLINSMPLSRRQIFEYLQDTGPVAVDVTLLTVADRLSARGSGPIARKEVVEAHLDLAALFTDEALRLRREGSPQPLLDGNEIAAELGLDPGPRIGELVRELAAAQFAQEVSTRPQAIAHLRSYCAR